MGKWLTQLNCFQNCLDMFFAREVASFRNAKALIEQLKRPITSDVFIFSFIRDMQGVVMPLKIAIKDVYKSGCGSIFSSIGAKNNFWFYFREEGPCQYFFCQSNHPSK